MAERVKSICPYCGELAAYRHQAHCNKNPNSVNFRPADSGASRPIRRRPASKSRRVAPRAKVVSRTVIGPLKVRFCYQCSFDFSSLKMLKAEELGTAGTRHGEGVVVKYCPICCAPVHRLVVEEGIQRAIP